MIALLTCALLSALTAPPLLCAGVVVGLQDARQHIRRTKMSFHERIGIGVMFTLKDAARIRMGFPEGARFKCVEACKKDEICCVAVRVEASGKERPVRWIIEVGDIAERQS